MKVIYPYRHILLFMLLFQLAVVLFPLVFFSFNFKDLTHTLIVISVFNFFLIAYFSISTLYKLKLLIRTKSSEKNWCDSKNIYFCFTKSHIYYEDSKEILIFRNQLITDIFYERNELSVIIRHPMGSYTSLAPEKIRVPLVEEKAERLLKWFSEESSIARNKVIHLILREPICRDLFIFFSALVISIIFTFFSE